MQLSYMNYFIESVDNNIITISETKGLDNYIIFVAKGSIVIKYNCVFEEKEFNLEICLNDIEINRNKISIDNIQNVKYIIISYNDIIKKYYNIKITKNIKKYLFLFNENESQYKILDVCLNKIDNSKSKKEFKYNKLVNIITCNEIFSIFKNININGKNKLFLFIYKIILRSVVNNLDELTFDVYSKKIFKNSIAINPRSDLFKIYNEKKENKIETENLSNDFKIELDTGNESYTKISEKFFIMIVKRNYTEIIDDININVGSLGGDTYSNIFVKFKIILDDQEFTILATVDNLLSNMDIDVLLGSKCGLDLFYASNFNIDKKYFNNDKTKIDKLRAHEIFIVTIDNYLINTHSNLLEKNKKKYVTIKNIDDFVIMLIFLIYTYNFNIKRIQNNKTLLEITESYNDYVESGNILKTFYEFISKKNLVEIGSQPYFFNMTHDEYEQFTEKHFTSINILHKLHMISKTQLRNKDYDIQSIIKFKGNKKIYKEKIEINKNKFKLFVETTKRLIL